MTANELYPNAPVAMVVAEIKHPATSAISAAELQLLKSALSESVPIARTEDVFQLSLTPPSQPTSTKLHRFVSRDLRHSVSYREDAIVVETTNYLGWDAFIELTTLALHARQDVSPVDGLERIGVRFLDEIRVPEAPVDDWSQWVSTELLGPQSIASAVGFAVTGQQGLLILAAPPADNYVIRFGTGVGQSFPSTPNLRRGDENTGPFFLLDTDGSWTPAAGGIPEFSIPEIIDALQRLHKPMSAIFEQLITHRLRNEVLRHD